MAADTARPPPPWGPPLSPWEPAVCGQATTVRGQATTVPRAPLSLQQEGSAGGPHPPSLATSTRHLASQSPQGTFAKL